MIESESSLGASSVRCECCWQRAALIASIGARNSEFSHAAKFPNFNAAIQHAIEDCYLVLVCFPASVQSDWVIKEVMFGNQSGKDILPVTIASLPGAHPLKLVLVNHQMLDATEAGFPQRLKTAINSARTRAFGS